jgi:hypothetical protein
MPTSELFGRPAAGWVPEPFDESEMAFDMLPRTLAAVVMAIVAGLVTWWGA